MTGGGPAAPASALDGKQGGQSGLTRLVPRSLAKRIFGFELGQGRHPLVRSVPVLAMVAGLLWTGKMALDNLLAWYAYGQNFPLRTDFALYYVFARIGLAHGWGHLYDLAAQRQVYNSLGPIWWFPLPYTPPMAWVAAPFTALSLHDAYWLWIGFMTVAFLLAWWLAAPEAWLPRLLCLTAALSPYLTLLGLELGQFIPFQLLAIAACCWLLERDRPVAAGLALTPIALHPQGFFLVPVALLVAGRWRTVAAWCVSAGLLGLASLATLGLSGTQAYLQRLNLADRNPLQFYVAFQVDLPLTLNAHHLPHLITLGVEAAIGLLVVVAAWRHRRSGAELAMAAGLIGSVLITSFIHLDDLMVLLPAAWLLLRRRPTPGMIAACVVMLLATLSQIYGAPPRSGQITLLTEIAALAAIALAGIGKATDLQDAPMPPLRARLQRLAGLL